MARIIAVYLCIGFFLPHISSKKYRTDYVYNEDTDAFYKIHIESVSFYETTRNCVVEGTELILPSSHQDIVQVHRMFKEFPDLGEFMWVKDDGGEHESAEEPAEINFEPQLTEAAPIGPRMCNVISRSGEIMTVLCLQKLPFVCKVEAKDAYYDGECKVYGKNYIRSANISGCYKIPTVAYTWNQAYAECSAEGAHLVILNSEAEHNYVEELMKSRRGIVADSKESWFFFAGFRAEPTTDGTPRMFKTIFNETLEEAGYNTWAANEPNNMYNNENCGSLFKNDGSLNDLDCTQRYGFICEKEIS